MKKVNVNASMFEKFRSRIASEFPQWKANRLVQLIQNGSTVAVRPLNGYQLSDEELAIVASIEADFAECEPDIEETHTWHPAHTPRRHYATQKQIVRQLEGMRF